MKFFLYYFNYSEFNLENSVILYFGAYTIYTNQMSLQQPIKTVTHTHTHTSIQTFFKNHVF